MKRLYILFFIALCCLAGKAQDTVKSNLNKYYPVNQLKADFVFFRTVLEIAHPSLYRYFPKDSIDHYFDAGFAKLTDSLTEAQYWQVLQNIVAKIGSGHTTVSMKDGFPDNSAPHYMLPFLINIQNNRLFVRASSKTDTVFKTGDEIMVINNEYAASILQQMRGLVSGDGYLNNFKDIKLQGSIPQLYNLVHGDQYQFMVFFKRDGRLMKKVVSAVKMMLVTTGGGTSPKMFAIKKLPLIYPADIPSTAVLKIHDFTYSDYYSVHSAVFKELKLRDIKNLVIDLRYNMGGHEKPCIDLMQYLMTDYFRFHVSQEGAMTPSRFKSIIMQNNKSPKASVIKDLITASRPFREKTLGNRIQAIASNGFKGNLYLLTNRGTYSAAALFAVAVKAQRNCTIIGEETGGGMAGCDGGETIRVILPNTQNSLYMPTLWTYSVSKEPNYGRGLKPDIEYSDPPDNPYREYMSYDPIMGVVKKAIMAAEGKTQ